MSRGDLKVEPSPLLVYTLGQGHSSVVRAALPAGLGRDNVAIVAHDGAYAMRAESLAEAVERDVSAGQRPCAVVATTGIMTSTAIDPAGAVAHVANEHGLWLHVDTAIRWSARR